MNHRTVSQLREDALALWNAGVDGVRVDRLMREYLSVNLWKDALHVGEVEYSLASIRRIVVVGGGKASGAMAEALEAIFAPMFGVKEIAGWVNVPDDCAKPLQRIKLHPARPMGVNEPTDAAVAGTEEIVRLLQSLEERDLCINLLSGGGSALLVAPVEEFTLQDILELTRFLSESGAAIQELNAVRKQISRIKGGGMKNLCRGKQLVSLILSDVLGNPLDVVASGPTVDNSVSASETLDIVRKFLPKDGGQLSDAKRYAVRRLLRYLETKSAAEPEKPEPAAFIAPREIAYDSLGGSVQNIVVGSNITAVEAASEEAFHRKYSAAMYSDRTSEITAEQAGIDLVQLALEMRSDGAKCLIHGGEPVVQLAPAEIRGRGGRNQQLVLSALVYLLDNEHLLNNNVDDPLGFVLLSGGTDGEDGPTDAAGAVLDSALWNKVKRRMREQPGFSPKTFLERNDAYTFFEQFDALLKTGTTGTNVCDLRIVTVN